MHNLFNTLEDFVPVAGKSGKFYSLPRLEKEGIGAISRLPVSIRIVLESVLRNYDGERITEKNVRELANWQPNAGRTEEIPFVVARVILQDFTGVPLLVDLAAMRSAVARLGKSPKIIEPLVPVDLVIDHSVQVDYAASPEALRRNMQLEFERNRERYAFLKWGMQAFEKFRVIPPGIGIIHQVNLEYLARGVLERDGLYYPDTLVGTDSHTTMINGLGIVGWGVGGIEAEAAMLGQPVYFLTPDVVGFHMKGSLREGVTATDLVLHCTEVLRKAKVVGKFVEFYGEGAARLSLPDRATIANMAPEYGATMGFFPVDEETCKYLLATGRSEEQVEAFRNYFKAQGLFGIPSDGQCDYSQVIELELADVVPAVAGPKRPQDRIELSLLKNRFDELLSKPVTEGGYGKAEVRDYKVVVSGFDVSGIGTAVSTAAQIGHGSVLIAAITSCTNTSNPSVMLAAGLLAKKAVEKGLKCAPWVKTSLAPGSRVVSDYLRKSGLQQYLDVLGFHVVGYGCTTCIGNSGPLDQKIEEAVVKNDLVAASVLSGNRNFEARVHPSIKANFLMSPPLVVAFALAGRVDIDITSEPLGRDLEGNDVYLKDLWPSMSEINDCVQSSMDPSTFRRLYGNLTEDNPLWEEVPSSVGELYAWDASSTYIQEPPFFVDFTLRPSPVTDIRGARALAIFSDSVTTDHISPAGAIKKTSPAGIYLQEQGVRPEDFNTYGSRRGNDRVMTRGTFANVRIKNLMCPGTEGGVTKYWPEGELTSIYEAAMRYAQVNTPLVVFAGHEYGTGSSRDWAAKGTRLLGVRAVIAQSFERIHRSNLVGMGVLPLQFKEGVNAQTLGLDGSETYDILGLEDCVPQSEVKLVIHKATGQTREVELVLRIDTPIELEYYQHGGILPYVLRQLLARA
ncbi:MAG: aconitate hydratase AcnA [Acidobacteriota bacterium]|nr:aconitate hydratase AcnA [Blastocatellia bacterium]MDW8413785.1 aconitate hydratase AcnA [Acidobacteriota bacterium]